MFGADELDILASPNARLTGDCINACIALIRSSNQVLPGSQVNRMALFSSYDILPLVYSKGTERIWSLTGFQEYWRKDAWVIPIHRRYPVEHWVSVLVLPQANQIMVFDSLHNTKAWQQDVKVRDCFCQLKIQVLNQPLNPERHLLCPGSCSPCSRARNRICSACQALAGTISHESATSEERIFVRVMGHCGGRCVHAGKACACARGIRHAAASALVV